MQIFINSRRAIYSCVIFQEFMKEIAASLYTKELIAQMVEAYDQAYMEDIKLECALATFSKQSKSNSPNAKPLGE